MSDSNGNLCCQELPVKIENFWRAMFLFISKPHTVCRQLAGAEQTILYKIQGSIGINQLRESVEKHEAEEHQQPTEKFLLQMLVDLKIDASSEKIDKTCFHKLMNQDPVCDDISVILLNKLLAKNLKCHTNMYELVYLDFVNASAFFISLNTSAMNLPTVRKSFLVNASKQNSFHLQRITIKCFAKKSANEEQQRNWVQNTFFPKFLKWIESFDDDYVDKKIESLQLVNLEEYNALYNTLKEKYGRNMVKIWPEQTDPAKFVYEDVAIASYLLLIWKREREKNNSTELQSFVDLGCGNGLLVYILSSEGHRGYGIDIRKRGIWDLYPSATTDLRTEKIIPSAKFLYPDIDWIIGNHSDELSPWIPIIAARSSFNTRYFLLPCCAYEFSGKKYQRRNGKKSQYLDFLDYTRKISEICGFHTEIDRLKIPSTKRICLIGNKRLYEESKMDGYDQAITSFIATESELSSLKNESDAWNTQFTPRSDVEKVQNCTKIDKTVEKEIITIVFNQLTAKKRYVEKFIGWNIGGKISMSDIAKLIPKEKLKELKSECGGLQTLLKNNSQIFRVDQGIVEIRMPVPYCDRLLELEKRNISMNKSNRFQFKQRACWFLSNHPDGCPLSADDCSFKH